MAKIYEALEQASKERYGKQELSVGLKIKDESYSPPDIQLASSLTGLYQNITQLLPNRKCRIVQFVSSRQGEGTSTLVRELAKLCAFNMKKSTLLLDADRKQTGHLDWFNLKTAHDWNSAIRNRLSVKETICQVRNTRLFVSRVASGNTLAAPNPGSSRVDAFLDELQQDFELVLIDTSPATLRPDNFLLFRKADGVILVVEAEKTRWQVVKKVKDRIEIQGGNILGVLLNKRKYHIPRFIYKRM